MYRQGDVILVKVEQKEIKGNKLGHLVLAEGEVSGHKHQISSGTALLYESPKEMYLDVVSETALLTHDEHSEILLPQGTYKVLIQREYDPRMRRKSRPVLD